MSNLQTVMAPLTILLVFNGFSHIAGAQETVRPERGGTVILFNMKGAASSAKESTSISAELKEAMAETAGYEVVDAAAAAAALEQDASFREKVETARKGFADAVDAYRGHDYASARLVLEETSKILPDCFDLLYPSIVRDNLTLWAVVLHASGDRKGAMHKFTAALKADPSSEVKTGAFPAEVEEVYLEARKKSISGSEIEVDAEKAAACVSGLRPLFLIFPEVFYKSGYRKLSVTAFNVGRTKEVSLRSIPLEKEARKRKAAMLKTFKQLFALAGEPVEPERTAAAPEAPPFSVSLPEYPASKSEKVEPPLALRAEKPAEPPAAFTAEDGAPRKAGTNILGWTLAGLALASAGAAATFGILEVRTETETEKFAAVDNPKLPDSQGYMRLKNKGDRWALLANVFWGIAGAFTAGSAGVFLFGGDGKETSSSPRHNPLTNANISFGNAGVAFMLSR